MIIIQGNKAKYWLGILAATFLGMTYVVAGMGKWFAGVVEFELHIFPGLLPPTLIGALNTLLSPTELAIGILLASGILVKPLAGFSLLLTTGFIINNIILISQGLGGAPCGCFGMGNRLTVYDSLLLDGIMIALVITVLCWYPTRFFEARPWFWRK